MSTLVRIFVGLEVLAASLALLSATTKTRGYYVAAAIVAAIGASAALAIVIVGATG
ncbi:hypothetical protein [Skermania sp. ID1734]|uniref:hypothetical protein n=1 Tax=Skermania sp. ID1734 TaxID=2597516 RepID=UPI00163DB276|nr:hypothetical protein [Skermania sp. ID1734]